MKEEDFPDIVKQTVVHVWKIKKIGSDHIELWTGKLGDIGKLYSFDPKLRDRLHERFGSFHNDDFVFVIDEQKSYIKDFMHHPMYDIWRKKYDKFLHQKYLDEEAKTSKEPKQETFDPDEIWYE